VTNKPKHGHQKRRAHSPGHSTTVPSGTFRMVAAANPGPSLSVGAELDLVKAALLYGDKVTLLSPVTTMLLRAEGLQHFSSRRIADLLCRVAPVLLPLDQLAAFQQSLSKIDQLLRPTLHGGISDWQREALHELLGWGRDALSEAVREINANAGIDQLARARREGLVKIENADPGDEIDLLASCIISAKLAQAGQRQDNPQSGRVVETFVDKLSKHLSAGKEYLIFDEPIASLTEAAIREGLFSPDKGPKGRSAQAMAASGLIGRLPTFPTATVDEVLDIRRELAPSLTQFRSAMVTISKTFASAPWESDFEDELQDAWVETVCPAVEAIEASVRDDHSLLSRSAGLIGTAKAAWAGLAICAAGFLGHADVLQALGGAGALAGAAPVLQTLRDRRNAHNTIRMQPFYFLYGAEQALQ
jgi:hypothetical protein